MMRETLVSVPLPFIFAMSMIPEVLCDRTRDIKPKTLVEQTKFQHVVKDIG